MNVDIVEISDMKLLCYPHRGPYEQIGEAFSKLYGWAAPRGYVGPGVYGFAVYYDDPGSVAPEDLKSDACVNLTRDIVVEDPLTTKTLKGGKFAKYLCPYSGLGAAWNRMMGEYIPSSGLQIDSSRNSFEKYLNDCNSTPAEKLETEIHVPVL